MSEKIRISDFAHEESLRRGCTEEGYKAGFRLLQMAVDGDDRADFDQIASIQPDFDVFYPWYRIKAEKFGVRVIAETRGEVAILIAVLPRSIVYDDVMPLWKKYRTLRPAN